MAPKPIRISNLKNPKGFYSLSYIILKQQHAFPCGDEAKTLLLSNDCNLCQDPLQHGMQQELLPLENQTSIAVLRSSPISAMRIATTSPGANAASSLTMMPVPDKLRFRNLYAAACPTRTVFIDGGPVPSTICAWASSGPSFLMSTAMFSGCIAMFSW